MVSNLYLAPRQSRRMDASVQIARPAMLHARLAYREMRRAGVTPFDARQWVYLLIHAGQLTQRYITATANYPKELYKAA